MTFTRHLVAEVDLHGFVDGQLSPERRADVLRLLATSKTDRATVEAWQDQTDALRNAFAGVEREPLPSSLNLSPLPCLRIASVAFPPGLTLALPERAAKGGRRVVAALSIAAVVLAGTAGAWALRDAARRETAAEPRGMGSLEEGLAGQALNALETEEGAARSLSKTVRHTGAELPTTTIPDLGRAGFDLVRADAALAPASLVFLYENASADRVAISVARAVRPTAGTPAQIGEAFTWRRRDNVYAIAGTTSANRLRALAVALQGGDGLD